MTHSTSAKLAAAFSIATLSIAALAILLGYASPASAADWPQWQGPARNGTSKEQGLLQEWPKDGPPLAWKIDKLGGGDSAPAIAAGRIFGMSNRGSDEVVWALSEKDGSPLWSKSIGSAVQQSLPQGKEGPAGTPSVDGDRLYVLGMGGRLACLKAKDGEIVWKKSLPDDFGGRAPTWSYRESPLVDGDKVICTPGGPDALLVALNKLTGETIWKSTLPERAGGGDAPGRSASGGGDAPGRGPGGSGSGDPPPGRPGGPGRGPGGGPGGGFGGRGGAKGGAAYASAIAIDFEAKREYVQFTAKGVIGVAAADGKFLWRYDAPSNGQGVNCSTPLYQDGTIFASSAYGAGGGLVKLKKGTDGAVETEEVYFSKRMQNHHGGMVVVDNCLYGASGGNEGGALVCLDFQTGKILWDERGSRRAPKGSILFADGRLYYRTEDGTLLLIEPNKEKYVELGRFEQPDRSRSPAWSHPVIANGKLYVRDQNLLFCYDVKAK